MKLPPPEAVHLSDAADAADATQTAAVNPSDSGASNVVQEAPTAREDWLLVQRVQQGDTVAFRALFDKYHRRAYAVAYGVLKSRPDAMDVVQEAFVKVHKHVAKFEGQSSFYTWLYRIVMNLCIDQIRKSRKVTEFDERIGRDEVAGDGALLPKLGENPSKSVSRQEMSTHIHSALAQLPDYHRAVIVLREVEGLSYEEMADILKVPKGTIMSRLFHARRKMQELLTPYLEGDLDIVE